MFLQPLEPRHLLSVGSELSHGVLRIEGTDYFDVVRFEVTTVSVKVFVDPIPPEDINFPAPRAKKYRLSDIELIVVELGAGDDQIDLSRLRMPAAVAGGQGGDIITGSQRNDTIKGGEGDDRIDGHTGGDLILGGQGSDSLDGNSQNDSLFGGSGRDTLVTGSGAEEIVDGGTGSDRASIASPFQPTRSIERTIGVWLPYEPVESDFNIAISRESDRGNITADVRFASLSAAYAVEWGRIIRRGNEFIVDVKVVKSNAQVITDQALFRINRWNLYRLYDGAFKFTVTSGGNVIKQMSFTVQPGWRGEKLPSIGFIIATEHHLAAGADVGAPSVSAA